jgi:hypothetical protein
MLMNVSTFKEIIMEMYILIAGVVGVAIWFLSSNKGHS